jgi:hypothetical protein
MEIAVTVNREKRSVVRRHTFFEISFVNGNMNCEENDGHLSDQKLWLIRAATATPTIPAPAN